MPRKKEAPRAAYPARERKEAVLRSIDDPRREGPLGVLFAVGKIGPLELAAAARFYGVVRRYAMVLDTSFSPAKVSKFEVFYGVSHQPDMDDDRAARIKEDYKDVKRLLGGMAMHHLMRAYLYGEGCEEPDLIAFALKRLVRHFGLREDDVQSDHPRRIVGYRAHGARPTDRPDLRLVVDNTVGRSYAGA